MDEHKQYAVDIVSAFAQNTIKKLWIVIIILIILLAGTNAAWIIYESQYEIVEAGGIPDDSAGNVRKRASGNIFFRGRTAENSK